MSLTMHSTRAMDSTSKISHVSSGAVKNTSRPVGTAKHRSSFTPRALPKGPGPLPDKPSMNRASVKFVPQPSRNHASTSKGSNSLSSASQYDTSKKSYTSESPTTRRKVSGDSGYGSTSGKDRTGNYRYGRLSNGRKSKSLSWLGPNTDLSTPYSVDCYEDKYATRNWSTQRNKNSKPTLYESSISDSSRNCRSTTHADYKDPWGERTVALNGTGTKSGQSHSLEKSGSSKSTYNIFPTDTSRKSTITAVPGSDMRCARKSSFSSSNSSPSNSPTRRGSSDGLVGLRNLGNTCFMNSILQCLSHTQPFTEQLSKGSHLKTINMNSSMKGKLIQAFADLIKSMWKHGNGDAVSPHSFKTQIQRFAPRFMGYNQQDAQEFLHFLLEGLHDDLNRVKCKPKFTPCEFDDSLSHQQNAEKSWESYLSRDNSLVTDLFVGQLNSMLKCCTCGHTSVTFDPFWDLSLPIPRKSRHASSSPSWSVRRSSGEDYNEITLRDCILSFTKEEVLDGDERPTCDKCKTKRKSTKKFSIQRFPPILVLHLKRFSGFSFRSKLQTNVEFPLNDLDLTEFAADSQEGRSVVYSLYAVSNHSGSTYGGHYMAYCKHPISRQWHCFNDSRVDGISRSRVPGAQAYILFYEKVDRKSSP